MRNSVFGAFTLLVVVNGQDVTITCSVCGDLAPGRVDRRGAIEARSVTHIADHVFKISKGYVNRDNAVLPGEHGDAE